MQEIHCLTPRSHEEAQQILAERHWLLHSEPEKAEQSWYTDEVPRQSAAPQLCFSRSGEGSALSASCSHPRLVTGLFCVRKRCSGWFQVSAGRGNEGLALVLLLNPAPARPQPHPSPVSPAGAREKDQLGPEGSRLRSSPSANSEAEAHAGEALWFVSRPARTARYVGGEDPTDHQEEGSEHVCNAKADSRRRGCPSQGRKRAGGDPK